MEAGVVRGIESDYTMVANFKIEINFFVFIKKRQNS